MMTRRFREEREREEMKVSAPRVIQIIDLERKMMIAAEGEKKCEREREITFSFTLEEEKGATRERNKASRTLVNSTTGLASAASAIFYVRVMCNMK